MNKTLCTILVSLVVSACGSAPQSTLLHADLTTYALHIDDFVTSDFSTYEAVHTLDAKTCATATRMSESQLANDHFDTAVSVHFFRTVSALGTSNGPIDVISTVARFGDITDAQRAFQESADNTDHATGETAISTGRLGDEAHADTKYATADGVRVLQVTLLWRVDNIVSWIVLRGRDGGTRLDDALTLAQRQLHRQV